jgi:hypothetical protein
VDRALTWFIGAWCGFAVICLIAKVIEAALHASTWYGSIGTVRDHGVDFEQGVLRLPDSKTGAKLIYLNGIADSVIAHHAARSG